ncbi:MAG: class I tRNA ligase family protein, partial [Candidatus Hadarchaeales archaeon]
YVGRKVEVPACGRKVEVIQDPEVDPNFGTGVVMICTYGDKTDVRWVARYGLPVIRLLDERGRLTGEAGKYAGLSVEEARRAILEDLEKEGDLLKQERLVQSVGVCWRCKTPVEILTKKQWFMRVLDLRERVVEEARKVRWVPEYMGQRLVDWANSMDWDWVISRQRIFATPIPVWYCRRCGETVVAEEDQLPVNPLKDRPRGKCPRCGGEDFEGERDVLDTWMDSSITIAAHAGWPNLDRRLFPADLQPNGTDIIRTWDYYLMVRHLALLGEAPYRTVLINGMVFGEDGRKMSKSLGNFIETSSVYGKYGADALRQWSVLAASTGSDVPFSWKEVVYGYRFMQKLWNAVRFAGPHLGGVKGGEGLKLRAVDRWILSRLQRLVERVTSLLEDFQFNQALISLQSFVWHEFCDLYIEEVKHRLYGGRQEEVRYVLREVVSKVCRLLAPFIPHLTEEIYQTYLKDEGYPSVHLAPWPSPEKERVDEEAERTAELLHLVLGALRQFKSSHGLPLSGELEEVRIFASPPVVERLREVEEDLVATAHLRRLHLSSEKPELEERVVAVEPDLSRLGPRLRSGMKKLAEFLREHGGEVAQRLERGPFTLELGGERVELSPGDLRVRKEVSYEGEGVEVVRLQNPDLLLVIRR